MQTETCHHCGYDLTGLSGRGRCPECGKPYDTGSLYRVRHRENPIARHITTIGFCVLALIVLICGGIFTLIVEEMGGDWFPILMTTLVIAALPAFGAFAYWWSERQERRDSD